MPLFLKDKPRCENGHLSVVLFSPVNSENIAQYYRYTFINIYDIKYFIFEFYQLCGLHIAKKNCIETLRFRLLISLHGKSAMVLNTAVD